MTGSNSFWFANPGDNFYNGVATQSVRFNQPSSSYLYKSVSDGTRTKSTFAWWMKRGQTTIGSSNIGEIFCFGGSGGGGSQSSGRITLEANKINIAQEDNNSTTWEVITTQLLRDFSAWYHCVVVIDTTQSTDSDKVRVYINGNKVTSFSTSNYPSTDSSTRFGLNGVNKVGVSEASGSPWSATYFDGYFADMYYLDGVAVSDSSDVISEFGEFKNGVWIAKEYTGSFGTNGFRFKFDQTGTGTGASDTIGADSGNTNHYTSSGIDADGCNMPDSPENNFATLNALTNLNTGVLSEGNLKYTVASGDTGAILATHAVTSGKWYWEFRNETANKTNIGIANIDKYILEQSTDVGTTLNQWGFQTDGKAKHNYDGTNGIADYGSAIGNTEIGMIALNMDTNDVWFGREGAWFNTDGSADSATVLAQIIAGTNTNAPFTNVTGTISPLTGRQTSNNGIKMNFGQDSSFAGVLTGGDVGTETPSEGAGVFKYAPPSGYLALCTANLPEPTIGPNSDTQADDHFAPLIYSASSGSAGAGSSTPQDIDGLDFKPDLVWIKGRGYADHHALFDSSRGEGKYLLSSSTNAEGSVADTLDEFRVDGFGLGADSTALVNYQNNTYVSWNWKANGGTTTTNDASSTGVGSIDSVYQANTTAGFSIVTHTGTGSVGTIAHGLGKKPALIITKGLSDGYNWFVYNHISGATKALLFDAVVEDSYSTTYNNTEPTSSVFTVGTATATNGNTINYINYIFAEIDGYSKIGTYVANADADGPFIYTGFRPSFVVVKKLASSHGWEVTDSARNPFNEMNKHLLWDTAAGDTTADPYDFCANGFKLRTSGYTRNRVAGKVLLYMAFAEAPFKYANAR